MFDHQRRPWSLRDDSDMFEHEEYRDVDEPSYFADRQFTRHSNFGSRQSQAAAGRARLSLPPTATAEAEFDDYSPHPFEVPDRGMQDLVAAPMHYQLPTVQQRSSSPGYGLPSSPTFQASQRQHPSEASQSLPSMPQPQPLQQRPQLDPSNHGKRPVVQGIELLPVHDLPDRFRSIFPFNMFNAVQSGCFESIYGSDDNCVISSPTGSGKTVLFELAICRLIRGWESGSFKLVYMAPTKSLCSERTRDWRAKFGPLNLKCEEMTGDSDTASLYNVQRADIIVTTPEKWDSMTRKWKDHEKLVRLIKLFLIDEVHILSKDRGATLEAVVSRMKSIESGTRFMALSATVPNSQDVATWLGRNDNTPNLPAIHKKFGQEFRPVELKRYVCGYQTSANPFGFDSILTKKKSCSETASFLAEWWRNSPQNRYWNAPTQQLKVDDKTLLGVISAGVAFHHAGIGPEDRSTVEQAFLSGELGVICSTSTLAVGVNLPCQMAIIKNTASYEGGAVKEYSDLEIMQMIGRAGRPQFDTTALAVIMTRLPQVKHYEQLLNGQERLESCLHLNLVEHMNAEIGLGMVPDLSAAKKWLGGTFLKVRLEDNPAHYRIQGDTPERNLNERLERICASAISQLKELTLIETDPQFRTTEYGEAMARYCINIITMKMIVNLPAKPKISELLSVISQAHEFRELRFRGGEKQVYKELNGLPDMRFPSKIDLAMASQKVSLVIQSVLGGIGLIAEHPKHRTQYNMDQTLIYQHVNRLIRCIIDCQNFRNDAVGIRNSLMLSRSLAAKVWDDSPMVLKQIEQIGAVTVRKLVGANICSIEELENTTPGRIETILGRAPPFGWNLLRSVQSFPKLRISVQMVGQSTIKQNEHVLVNLKVDFGFMNEKPPTQYRKKPLYVIMLAGISDGRKAGFFRISAQKLDRATPVTVTAALTSHSQHIECYVMCDELAGTMQQATIKPEIAASAFQSIREVTAHSVSDQHSHTSAIPRMESTRQSGGGDDEWGDGGIGDEDFVGAEPHEDEFEDINGFEFSRPVRNSRACSTGLARKSSATEHPDAYKLANGNFACNHKCKDKTACRHLCCNEGLEKKPKPPKSKDKDTTTSMSKVKKPSETTTKVQSKLGSSFKYKKDKGGPLEHIDLSQTPVDHRKNRSKTPAATLNLLRLHNNTSKEMSIRPVKPFHPSSGGARSAPSFLQTLNPVVDSESDDFDDLMMDEHFPSLPENILGDTSNRVQLPADIDEEFFDQDEDMLDAALIGLDDSQMLHANDSHVNTAQDLIEQAMGEPESDRFYNEFSGGSNLFITPMSHLGDTIVDREGGTRIHFDDGKVKDSKNMAQGHSGTKHEREEDMIPSSYFASKKRRIEVAAPIVGDVPSSGQNDVCFTDEHNVMQEHKQGEQDSKDDDTEELRAWLAAEFGDTIELI